MKTNNLYKMVTGNPRHVEPVKHPQRSLNQIVDGMFEDFAEKVRDDNFEEIHGQADTVAFIEALNQSENFLGLTTDILMGAGVPQSSISMLANCMAYFAFAGYKIHGAEAMSRSFEKLM